MSYQVLARKWRPRDFSELVGQEATVRTLNNALDKGRFHHAYLFTGTRGVGKTTIARILAKAYNCEQGPTAHPCGTCKNCTAINEGHFIDLIEIDAASRTKVEDTRELLENVQFLPSQGRFKIYLIDEVHMLSRHSFNALLKTLEEPPEHTKFFLATTDPQKLPATILSRCLKFHLGKISVEKISSHLEHILNQESIAFQSQAITLIAQHAQGSLRDALSLLDQAIAFSQGELLENDIREMLGISDHRALLDFLKHLAKQETSDCLDLIQQLDNQGIDFDGFLDEVLAALHAIAVEQAVPGAGRYILSVASDLASQFSAEDLQLFYQIGLKGKEDLLLAPSPRSGMEMIVLRMLMFVPDQPSESPLQNQNTDSAPGRSQSAPGPVSASKPQSVQSNKKNPGKPEPIPDWPALVDRLNLQGMAAQLAKQCQLQSCQEGRLTLLLSKNQSPLLTVSSRNKLENALVEQLGYEINLEIKTEEHVMDTPAARQKKKRQEALTQAQQAFEQDAVVQSIIKQFDGRIVMETVKPIE